MHKIIYVLCTLTALTCAWLLIRAYLQRGHRLLFWSGLSFAGLALSNLLLVLDKTIFLTTMDLLGWRLGVALLALILLLYGLIWGES